jgi:hypothetical protein
LNEFFECNDAVDLDSLKEVIAKDAKAGVSVADVFLKELSNLSDEKSTAISEIKCKERKRAPYEGILNSQILKDPHHHWDCYGDPDCQSKAYLHERGQFKLNLSPYRKFLKRFKKEMNDYVARRKLELALRRATEPIFAKTLTEDERKKELKKATSPFSKNRDTLEPKAREAVEYFLEYGKDELRAEIKSILNLIEKSHHKS